jgi:hypothetical protein
VEVGHAEGIGYGALVSEVGERDDDAVDVAAALLEEVGAFAGFFAGFDGSEFGFLDSDGDHLMMTGAFEGRDYVTAAGGSEVVREEAAVTDNEAKNHSLRVLLGAK